MNHQGSMTPAGRVVVRIGSRRDPRIVYTVRTNTRGNLSCDCPAFTCSKTKRCRHTDIVDVARQLAPEVNQR